MNIEINSNELKEDKNIINKEIKNLIDNIENLKNTVGKLSTCWKGEACEKFIKAYNNKIIPALEDVKDNLSIYANNLLVVADSYEELDRVFKENIEV